MKTLPIGLGAASRTLLDPRFEEGVTETLQSLWESDAGGTLESPPWTTSAWPSLHAGTNPGKHGVSSFPDFYGYGWSAVDASDVRTRPLRERRLRELGYIDR